ncbi:hypothetical protein [Streptomyces sp. NPDC013455]|uniref:hypothetical protein n=1 Tax=Streptomyces sp. NPDC013455 TaxID=3155605 RepID=UPI0033C7D5FD
MPNEPRSSREYEAEDAALTQAGPAQSHSDLEGAPRSAVPPEDRQRMLDEREQRFAGRRKPMGPTPGGTPESIPEDVSPDEQPSTTPEPDEP